MAASKSKRRSRKARAASRQTAAPPPPAVPAAGQAAAAKPAQSGPRVTPKVGVQAKPTGTRRQQREEREARALAQSAVAGRQLGTYGPRPRSIFHPVPVSEIMILAGIIAVIVGVIDKTNPTALSVGAIVCALGVFEFTAREHFSGYRSHATLLAAFPAVVIEVILGLEFGVPHTRILIFAPVVPIFALSFWLLHRAFRGARHARVVRSPAP